MKVAPGWPCLAALGAALLAGCGATGLEVGSGPPARLEVVSGQVITGLVGNVVVTPGFRVRSEDGGVLPGVTVRFRVEGSGTLARAEAVSGPDGVAAPGDQPLSAITVSSLRDLRDVVDDSKADRFPDGSSGSEHGAARGLRRSRTGPS